MRNKYILVFVFLITMALFAGCKKEINSNSSTKTEVIASTDEPLDKTEFVVKDQVEIEFNPEFLIDATNNLNSIGISDCWVGYNAKGNTSVWINSSEEKNYFSIDFLSSKYDAYLAKMVFDIIPDALNVYSMDNLNTITYSFYKYKKDKYINSELKGAPPNNLDFSAIDNTWEDVIDMHFVLDNLAVQAYAKYDPQTAFKRLIKKLLGDRLIDVSIEDDVIGAIRAYITVNGLPQDMSVNDEIAKILVLGMGRFSENLLFDNIYNVEITYKKSEHNILEATMFRGIEQELSQDFIGWLASGLNSKDWIKYGGLKILDSNFEFPEETNNVQLSPKRVYDDPGYEKVMDTLKGFKGVKDLVLGYNGTHYNALVTMEYSSEEEDFKNEMDITLEAMKYPFETIWFMVDDSNGTTKNMAYMDRERFNILTYMNGSDKFDFTPSEWPIMVKAYGEV